MMSCRERFPKKMEIVAASNQGNLPDEAEPLKNSVHFSDSLGLRYQVLGFECRLSFS